MENVAPMRNLDVNLTTVNLKCAKIFTVVAGICASSDTKALRMHQVQLNQKTMIKASLKTILMIMMRFIPVFLVNLFLMI